MLVYSKLDVISKYYKMTQVILYLNQTRVFVVVIVFYEYLLQIFKTQSFNFAYETVP